MRPRSTTWHATLMPAASTPPHRDHIPTSHLEFQRRSAAGHVTGRSARRRPGRWAAGSRWMGQHIAAPFGRRRTPRAPEAPRRPPFAASASAAATPAGPAPTTPTSTLSSARRRRGCSSPGARNASVAGSAAQMSAAAARQRAARRSARAMVWQATRAQRSARAAGSAEPVSSPPAASNASTCALSRATVHSAPRTVCDGAREGPAS